MVMDGMSQEQLDLLAQHFHLPEVSLAKDHAFTMILDNRYQITLEYNHSDELMVILKMPLPEYEYSRLEAALQSCSYLLKLDTDFIVAYGKEQLILFVNLGDSSLCTASIVEQAIMALINIYDKLP